MYRRGLTKAECNQFLSGYETILEHFHAEMPFNIYSKIIKTNARVKLAAAREFVIAEPRKA